MADDAEQRDRLTRAAEEYLQARKGWAPDEFRVEIKDVEPGGEEAVIWGIFLEDERHPAPGGGKSVELRLDRETAEVRRELAFQ